jgi:hypothetical protein
MSTPINPFEHAPLVRSREAFIAHVRALRSDLVENRDEWENTNLGEFLEALAAWVQDMDGYFADLGQASAPELTWALVAQMLCAAAVYE